MQPKTLLQHLITSDKYKVKTHLILREWRVLKFTEINKKQIYQELSLLYIAKATSHKALHISKKNIRLDMCYVCMYYMLIYVNLLNCSTSDEWCIVK